MRRIASPGAFHAGRAWVLHHRRAAGPDQFRVDVADLGADGRAPERAELVVQVGELTFDLAAGRHPTLPLVDVAADSVSFAVPHGGDGALPPVTVRYRGGDAVAVDVADRVDVGTARVMFVNFAIQGLNDLFATPDDDYQPPRSYTRLTMRDEAASYSSRPGSEENSVGDGYAFTACAPRTAERAEPILQSRRRDDPEQAHLLRAGVLTLCCKPRPIRIMLSGANS